MSLSIGVRDLGKAVVLDCTGRIVFGDEAQALRTKVKDLLASTHCIILNLEKVSYIDSGGLGTLAGLFTSARTAGGTIKLINLGERVRHALQITRLLDIFEVYDDEEQALGSVNEAA